MINIDEIVNTLYMELNPADLQILSECEEHNGHYGIEFHDTAGRGIRNRFHLWNEGNGDDLSAEILDRLIRMVKEASAS